MKDRPLSDRHILVVEDEFFLVVELERELESAGARVVGPAPSVAQALALIASEPVIDAAVVDVNLGGEPAYPVADACLARGVPFLFATGYGDGDLDARYPHVPRCEKPVGRRQVEQALATLLRG